MKILPNTINIEGIRLGHQFTAGPNNILCTLTKVDIKKNIIEYTYIHETLGHYTTYTDIVFFTKYIKYGWYCKL